MKTLKLYLLRHAPAAARTPGTADEARPLTPEGRARMRREARGMETLELSFDRCLCSPLLRARQTAACLRGGHGGAPLCPEPLICPALAPGGGAEKLVAGLFRLRPAPGRVLLVGHEPDLSRLVSALCCGGPEALAAPLKKGGLVRLSMDSPSAPARLDWVLPPRLLEALARGGA